MLSMIYLGDAPQSLQPREPRQRAALHPTIVSDILMYLISLQNAVYFLTQSYAELQPRDTEFFLHILLSFRRKGKGYDS